MATVAAHRRWVIRFGWVVALLAFAGCGESSSPPGGGGNSDGGGGNSAASRRQAAASSDKRNLP